MMKNDEEVKKAAEAGQPQEAFAEAEKKPKDGGAKRLVKKKVVKKKRVKGKPPEVIITPDGRKKVLVRKRKKVTTGQAFARLMLKIGIVAAVVCILVFVVGGVFICHNNDMYPAVRDGDLVITYRLGTYHTGDIIAYKHEGTTFFGRIVAETGDVIDMDADGNYTVNGIAPAENNFYETYARDNDIITYPYTIQPDELFVLADAREQGLDSRNFGPVKKPMGKVVLQLRRRGF